MAQRALEVQVRQNGVEEHQSGRSSPEMDFLEMDFDPGPSCEQVYFEKSYFFDYLKLTYSIIFLHFK